MQGKGYCPSIYTSGIHTSGMKKPPANVGRGLTNGLVIEWQEWRGSNPQPPVLETGALPIELHS